MVTRSSFRFAGQMRAMTVVSHPPKFAIPDAWRRRAQPAFLHGILSLAPRPQHTICHGLQPGPIGPEMPRQDAFVVHRQYLVEASVIEVKNADSWI